MGRSSVRKQIWREQVLPKRSEFAYDADCERVAVALRQRDCNIDATHDLSDGSAPGKRQQENG